MTKRLVIKPEVCIGCRSCELMCAFIKTHEFSSESSAITVYDYSYEGVIIPLMCMQCDNPSCVEVCPVGALEKNRQTGLITHNVEKCIGCKMCVGTCPLGNISFDKNYRRIIKCTLCDGQPKCITVCPVAGLDYVEIPENTEIRPL